MPRIYRVTVEDGEETRQVWCEEGTTIEFDGEGPAFTNPVMMCSECGGCQVSELEAQLASQGKEASHGGTQ